MIFDLHSHTTFSDGTLTPRELILRAAEKGVNVLAITDHDTLDAYQECPVVPDNIKLVAGIELSTQLDNTGIHVLGLNIDLASDAIIAAAKFQSDSRLERARIIGHKLEKKGIEKSLCRRQETFEGWIYWSPAFCPVHYQYRQGILNAGRI